MHAFLTLGIVMRWPFRRKKPNDERLNALDTKMDVILQRLSKTDSEENADESEEPETPETLDSAYKDKMASIQERIFACHDPDELEELLAMEKRIRKWYNARRESRMRRLNPPNPYGRSGAPPEEEEERTEAPPTQLTVPGVEPGNFDPAKLFGWLKNVIQENKGTLHLFGWDKKLEEQAGMPLDDLLGRFEMVVKDPEKRAVMAQALGGQITNVIKGAVTAMKGGESGAIVAQDQTGQGPPRPGMVLIPGRGWVDPTQPYQVG